MFRLIPVWYQAFQYRLLLSSIHGERNQEDLDLEIEAATVRPQNEKLICVKTNSLNISNDSLVV